jgi:FPC/CPF motif-containing protein YcgG
MYKADDNSDHPLAKRFRTFISDRSFPCVGAKAALQRDGMRFIVARDFGSAWDDLRIMPALLDLAKSYRADPEPFQSLIVLFETGAPEGFFVVGLHPRASRLARRFETPAMVFNLHGQFETLRADGRYERLRDAILERDLAASGSINPMLAQHGTSSSARQYSGRVVGGDWRCPFSGRGSEDAA